MLERSGADVSFLAAMLIDKFCWHLPLYRQHRRLLDAGITLSRSTLVYWTSRAIDLLAPLADAQSAHVLASRVLAMDETSLKAGRAAKEVAIDTNHLERALRPIPLGKRNWLFTSSAVGAQRVGIIQSLLVTCRLHEVDAYTYLVDVLQRISVHPATRAIELTPRMWKSLFAVCCFSHFLVEPPWELAGLFRRRIAWDDGAIREPVGAVAFPMSRCCRSGEDVGARAASVDKGWASAQHLSMPCPHAPQDAARSEGRVHIVTAGIVGGTAVVSASLGTREELARAGDTTPPGHDRCSFATRRG